MLSALIAACSSDLNTALLREPYSAVTQLRVIPLCESSFLEVHLARGVTFWVPTQTPQPLVTSPGSVSTFLAHYARSLPLAWPSHGSYLSQGPPSGGMSTSRVRLLPTCTRTMALKPPSPSLRYCSGLRLNLATPNLATPYPGDAHTWRRLHPGDASSSQFVDFLPWVPRGTPP